MRTAIVIALELLGTAAVVAGAALIYLPAAFVVAGVALIAIAEAKA